MRNQGKPSGKGRLETSFRSRGEGARENLKAEKKPADRQLQALFLRRNRLKKTNGRGGKSGEPKPMQGNQRRGIIRICRSEVSEEEQRKGQLEKLAV